MKTRSSEGFRDATAATHRPKCNSKGCPGCLVCDVIIAPRIPTIEQPSPKRYACLTPGKSYAEAVSGSPTGSLSTGSTRGHVLDYVTPKKRASSNALSSPSQNDIIENTIYLENQQFNCETTGPISDKIHKSRYKWTREEIVNLYWCYCYTKVKQLPITSGTFDIWRKRYPNLLPTMKKDKLSNQRRVSQKTLSEDEKIEIERNVKSYVEAENNPSDETPDSTDETSNLEPCQHENEDIDVIDDDDCPLNLKTNVETDKEIQEMIVKYYEEVLVMYRKYQMIPITEREKTNNFQLTTENRKKLKAMNEALQLILDLGEEISLTDLNTLHYAAAISIAGITITGSEKPKTEFDPDAKIKKNIEDIRKTIGKLITIQKGGKISKKMERVIGKKDTESTLRTYHMRLAAQSKKLRTKNSNRNRFINNKLFRNKQKMFYSKLRYGEGNIIHDPPSKEDVQDFWGNLYAEKAEHNKDAPWIEAERNMMKDKPQADWVDISSKNLGESIKNLSNWKAPGLDQVQNFWLKYLTVLHPTMLNLFNKNVKNPENAPLWLTGGRTTLIHKKGETSNAKNYRPITCLPTYYKLITSVLTNRLYNWVSENDILPYEQKGCRRKARGCKDHLLLDKTIMEDAKRKKKNVSFMWIDYKKAYDSMPHSWIKEILKIYKIDKTIRNFISYLMPTWRTKITLPHDKGYIETEDISFNKGIFQGDTLSPLLFCLALTPITNILKRAKVGYKIEGKVVSNLLYVDDLKLFAKSTEEMERCRKIVAKFSKDICMDFGLDKCAVIHTVKGKTINSPILSDIPVLSTEDSYRYLGILEGTDILHTKVKETAKKEYLTRIRSILKADINAHNTASAISTFAMPILRYGFGVLRWTQAELKGIDRKTRKIMTKYGFHHPKSDTNRLYIPRMLGGRGVTSVTDCYQQECTGVAKYLDGNNWDPLVDIVKKSERKRVRGLMSFMTEETMKDFKDQMSKERETKLMEMPMHGQWFRQQQELPIYDTVRSNEWLKNSNLRFETESLICAAQEQALATRNIQAKIWKNGACSKCRLCKEQDETINHIISGCKMLAATKYLHRHNQIATYLHWCIAKDMGVEVAPSWLKHKPQESVSKDGKVLLWDMKIITDTRVPANRPDIIVHDKEKKSCLIIDVAVPVDKNSVKKIAEKITKYRDLEIEIQKCWGLTKVKTVPIVVGALGTICSGLEDYLKLVSPNARLNIIQKTALLGTAHILRNVLTSNKN